jgi:uncharacterized protein YlxW (UPF0749 family)
MEDAEAAIAGDVSDIKKKVDLVLAQERLTNEKMAVLSQQQDRLAAEAKRIQAGVAAMFDRIGATQAGIDDLKRDVAALKRDVTSQLQVLTTIVTAIGADVRIILAYLVAAEVRRVRQLELRNLIMEMEDFVGRVRDRIALHVISSQLLDTLRTRAITKYTFDDVVDRDVFSRVTAILQRHRDALSADKRDELSSYRRSMQQRDRAAELLRTLAEAEHTLEKSQTALNGQIQSLSARAADLRANSVRYRADAHVRARRQARWSVLLLAGAAAVVGAAFLTQLGRDVAFLAILPGMGAVIAFLMAHSSRRYSPERDASEAERRATAVRAQLEAASTSYRQTLDSIRLAAASVAHLSSGQVTSEDLRKDLESSRSEHDRACRAFMTKHGEMRFAA